MSGECHVCGWVDCCCLKTSAPDMTLRDYFAAAALPAALAEYYRDGEAWACYEDLMGHVYNIADAMLKQRAKVQP